MNKIFLFILCLNFFSFSYAQDISLTPRLVGIQVKNLEASMAWYTRNLGFTLKKQMDFKEYKIQMAILEVNNFELELVEHENSFHVKDYAPEVSDKKPAIGFSKLTFDTKAIKKLHQQLKSNGITFTVDLKASNINPKEFFLMVSDPDGNVIQVIEE